MAAMKKGGAKELLTSTSTANIQLKGMKLRQEFCCPITYDLMRDPVVLADGHTYERAAIERWIRSNPSESGFIMSPLNGSRIEQTILSNLTMKKLIQDLINEGGAGLYTTDTSDGDRLFAVRPERILVFTCLGPPESEWNEQKFHVASSGCVGGRFVGPEHAVGRDIVSFPQDRTVSRVHFEIIKASADVFSMRDLGSAGGTYFRVAFGKRQALQPGVMFLIGKHHFMVSSIDDTTTQNSLDMMNDNSILEASSPGTNSEEEGREDLDDLITDAEQLLTVLDRVRDKCNHENDVSDGQNSLSEKDRQKIEQRVAEIHERMARLKIQGSQQTRSKQTSESNVPSSSSVASVSSQVPGKRCTLTCFLPDTSPFQGRSMMVDTRGATIGRKATNTICICAENPVDGKIATVDTAISSEHACIEYDKEDQTFYLMDGSRGANGSARRPSTNGTWYRLSGPHQQSAFHDLSVGLEVLIGTIRFGIGASMTISESNVESTMNAAQSKDERPSTASSRSYGPRSGSSRDSKR